MGHLESDLRRRLCVVDFTQGAVARRCAGNHEDAHQRVCDQLGFGAPLGAPRASQCCLFDASPLAEIPLVAMGVGRLCDGAQLGECGREDDGGPL